MKKEMTGKEVLELVLSQNGTLTQDQYLDIYDNSPTLQVVYYDEDGEFAFELVFTDKQESILCNVIV